MGVGRDNKKSLCSSQDKPATTVSRLAIAVLCILMFSLGILMSPALTQAAQTQESATRYAISDDKILHDTQDRISESQILAYDDYIRINKAGVKFAPVGNTASMLPFLHSGAHSLEVKPQTAEELQQGDIISFYVADKDVYVIHAIISTGYDEKGWYAMTKGYNNEEQDPWLVRFSDIEGVLIGVLY